MHFTEATFRPVVDCKNPLCYGGGVGLDLILNDIVRERQKSFGTSKTCLGYEGTKSRFERSCTHRFHVMAETEFKSED